MPSHLALVLRHPVVSGSAALAACALAGAMAYRALRRRPSAEELELRRRTTLAEIGRLIDGTVLDALPSEQEARVVFYRYRVAGVTYDCSQDVSTLAGHLADLRLDTPVQVRYDPHNPGDSIVVAESWSGLWHYEQPRRRV